MARDRKRAKRRQRRGPQPPKRQDSPAGNGPDPAEGEEEVLEDEIVHEDHEDEIVHEDHDDDPTAAPDPLAHISADADIARLAEASAREPGAPDTPLGEDEYPHRDETEGADAIQEAMGRPSEARAGAREVRPGAELPREGNRFANFLRACVAELRRVQWPDRRHVGQATGVVLGFVVLAGGYLGVLDAIFSRLVNFVL